MGLCLTLLGVGGVTACRGSDAKHTKKSRRRTKKARPVHVTRIQKGTISSVIVGTATLEAEAKVTVLVRVSGMVRLLRGREGRRFSRGALLARLKNPSLNIAYEGTALQVKKLKSDLKKTVRLSRKGYISQSKEEELRFQLAQAQNKLKQAREDLRNLRIVTPIRGVVTKRHITRGAWVNPNTAAFEVEDPLSLVAYLYVPEMNLRQLKPGLEARIHSEALGEKVSITGKVVRIAPVVDPKSGTIKLTIGKFKPLRVLRSGMFVSIKVIVATRSDVPLIPKQAVIYDKSRSVVYRLKGPPDLCPLRPLSAPSSKKGPPGKKGQRARQRKRGQRKRGSHKEGTKKKGAKKFTCRVEKVFFQKGFEDGKQVEARSAIRGKDRIVILGQEGLRQNSAVRVVKIQ